jgi:hypothetical protein
MIVHPFSILESAAYQYTSNLMAAIVFSWRASSRFLLPTHPFCTSLEVSLGNSIFFTESYWSQMAVLLQRVVI